MDNSHMVAGQRTVDSGQWTVRLKGILHKVKQRQVVDPRADGNPSWLNTQLGCSRTGETLLQGGVEETIEWEKAQWVRPNGWG